MPIFRLDRRATEGEHKAKHSKDDAMPPTASARLALASRCVAYANPRQPPLQVREVSTSVEERLRSARERYRLLADVFNLQAEASRSVQEVRLSFDGLVALRQLCVAAAEDLEWLARELPPAVANWRGEPRRDA
jgi:hypothetical protein